MLLPESGGFPIPFSIGISHLFESMRSEFMLKKLVLAAMLLPLTSLLWANGDDPNNPGDDNPGTTYITDDFTVGGFLPAGDSCFLESDFCTNTFIYPEPEQLRGKKKAAEAMAEAEEFAALACVTVAEANAGLAWFFEGGGDLTIARHGNHGAVHRIKLEADLAAATITVAQAAAEAGAGALAYAYAFASASSMADACAQIEVEPEPDPEVVQLCAEAQANANSNAQALAVAASFADAESFAASGSYGAAAIYNEVWAANIEKYQTALATGAGSFSFANAEASAEAFALAYADAYAYAFAQACAGEGAQDLEICGNGFNDSAQSYAWAYAYAYAEAQATALAAVEVEVGLPVMYKNENGIEDTVIFGPDETTTYDRAYVKATCIVPEDPNPEP
jgi:hypothetical protein